MEILGVRVDNLERNEILEKIESFLSENKSHQIATINPEFILQAQKNSDFKTVLNLCDLNVADGIGIGFAFRRFGERLKCRFAGVDLFYEILKKAEEKNLNIYLLVNKDGLSKFFEIKEKLLIKYPSLNIDGIDIDLANSIQNLKPEPPDLLFCNFGAPDQEIFLNLIKNDNIRLAMGVGGTFDFVSEKIKRAPIFMRKAGVEWLWRLLVQPEQRINRLKKIFRSVIIFPIKILFSKK